MSKPRAPTRQVLLTSRSQMTSQPSRPSFLTMYYLLRFTVQTPHPFLTMYYLLRFLAQLPRLAVSYDFPAQTPHLLLPCTTY